MGGDNVSCKRQKVYKKGSGPISDRCNYYFSCVYIAVVLYYFIIESHNLTVSLLISVLFFIFIFLFPQIASRSGTPITPSAASASASATQTIC